MIYGGMKFGEKLDMLIEIRGTSQSKLSEMTGIAQSAISDMTRGERRAYMDQSLKLAKALNVPLDFLADDDLDDVPKERMSETERLVWEHVNVLGPKNALDVLRETISRLMELKQKENPAKGGADSFGIQVHKGEDLTPKKPRGRKGG